jgi:quinol monooxygenase YgiN
MIKSVMYHKVEDFEKWKEVFDSFFEFRESKGELSYSVGTLHGDSNNVYVINEWESYEVLKDFVESKELGYVMKSAGVLEPPHTLILCPGSHRGAG